MRHTPVLNLKLPDSTDYVQIEDINENMEALEQEIVNISGSTTEVEEQLTTHMAQSMPHKYVGNNSKTYRWGLGEDAGGIYFAREEVI